MILFLGEGRAKPGAELGPLTLTVAAMALIMGVYTLGLFSYATVLATYRERGVFQRLRCAPVPAWQLLGARLLVQLLAVVAQALILFVVVHVAYGVVPGAQGALMALLAALVSGITALAIGQVVVALVGTANGVSNVSRVLLIVLLLLSGVFRAGADWPSLLQKIAGWTPIRLSEQLLRDALVLQHWGTGDLKDLLGLLVWIAVLAYVGISRFRWEASE